MRRFRWIYAAALLLFVNACGQTPDKTQKARGVLNGVNLILGLTVVVVVLTVVILVGVVAFDRMVTSRKRLEQGPALEPALEEDEVVAGITVGRASVPKWLYAAYVVIPLFAIAYVFANVPIQSQAKTTPKATTTPTGPRTEVTVVAAGIKFDVKELVLAAGKPITVTLDNKDTGVPHTFTVWKSEKDATANNASAKIADTGQFAATKTLKFNAPPPGTYYFNCTIHPTSMFGDIKTQ
jgi:plastocyanin